MRATGRTSATSTSTGRRTSTLSTSRSRSTSRASGCAATSGSVKAWRSTTSQASKGPPSSATTAPSRQRRRSAPTRCSARTSRLRERARVVRSIIDQSTFVGRSASVEGAIIGKSCDLRSHVHVHDGAALGDGVTIGAQTVVMPDVRIFPHKEVESGATVHESLVWEGGGRDAPVRPRRCVRRRQRRSDAGGGCSPGRRARHRPSAERSCRRQPGRNAACRMIKRAMVSGLTSTGISIADLRVLPAPVNRHLIRTQGYAAGFHVGMSLVDPEQLEIRFFEHTGTQLDAAAREGGREALTRATSCGGRHRTASARSATRFACGESYASDLLATLDAAAIIERRFRIVVDYGQSAASFVLPLVLGPLEVEAISAHEFAELDMPGLSTDEAIAQTKPVGRSGRRRPRRGLRPVRRAALPRGGERARSAFETGTAALPAPVPGHRCGRAASRSPSPSRATPTGSRKQPASTSSVRRRRPPTYAGRERERRGLCRGRGRCIRHTRLPAVLRRDGGALQAAGAAGARTCAALGNRG